jgi:aspartate/methionine/tyrosine aminotransferase
VGFTYFLSKQKVFMSDTYDQPPLSLSPFKLERYFSKYEFNTRILLSSSDCEGLSMAELLQMAASESLALWQELKLGYTESAGHPLLRSAVAQLYDQIPSDNVLVAAPEEAIFIAMHTLLKPGDHVIVVTPCYQSLVEIARSIGCRVTPWPVTLGTAGWQVDLDQLERSITPQTRLIVINFPHNPTGHQIMPAELDAIISLARQHGCTIFSDEMYRYLESDAALRLPAMCDMYEKGISLSGLSKSFALAGLRIGWLATRESALIERWLALKDYTTICNSAPSEILGIIALQNAGRIIQRNLAIIRENLALAGQFFASHRDRFSWVAPRAGSVTFPQWLGPNTVEQFCENLLEQHSVMLVPGSIFDAPGGHFRIGLGRRNFGEGLALVDEYLKSV